MTFPQRGSAPFHARAIWVVAALVAAPPLLARGVLVSPPQITLAGNPGETVSATLRVSSSQPKESQVRTSVADFTRDESGRLREIEAHARSARTWIDLGATDFVSPAGRPVELRVSATIPEDARGSYWALVRLEALPPARGSDGPGIQIVPTIVIPVHLTVSGTEKPAVEIASTGATHRKDGTVDAWALVRNSGNTTVHLSGAFALEQVTEKGIVELTSGSIVPVVVLPGSTMRLRALMPWQGSSRGVQVHTYLRYGSGVDDAAEAVTEIVDDLQKRPEGAADRLFPPPPPETP